MAYATAQPGIDRPRATLFLGLMIVLALGLGATRLSFDPRYATFFDANDPQLLAYEHLRAVFSASDTLAILVDPGPGGPFSAESLKILERLTEEAWQLPFALRVDSLVNVPWVRAEGDFVEISPLVEDAGALDAAGRAERERVVRAMPEVSGRLLEEKGPLTAVVVTVQLEGDPLAATDALMQAARALVERIEVAAPEMDLRIGGIVAMNHAFSESSVRDSARLLPIMLALMIGVLALALRSAIAVVGILLVMVAAVLCALGAAGWVGMALTTPTAIAPIVIVTVAIADGVHLATGARAAGADRRAALREGLRENSLPVLLTTATTVAGFLSLNFSAVPPFRDLGNIVAVGVAVAGALSLTVLPALFALAGGLPPASTSPHGVGERLVSLIRDHRLRILVGGAALLLLVLPGLARLNVNDDFVAYFDRSLPFREAAELADARLVGPYEIEYQLSSEGPDGIHDPGFLRELAAFTSWLRRQPETAHVLAWTDVLSRLHGVLDAEDASGGLPPDAEHAAQYTFLYEASLPLGMDLTNLVATDRASVRQLVALRGVDARAVRDFEARAQQWLAAHAPRVRERHGGINLMFAHISERNVRAMVRGNLLAVLVISAVLGIALRSVQLAGLSLLANLVPITAAFSLWGWWIGDVGLALGTAFGMTLGIVVDDTVHVLSRYRRLRGVQAPAPAMNAVVRSVAPALMLTTVTLVAGFAVLAASSFAINAQLARITLLTVVIALAVDLLALPALVSGAASRKARHAPDDRASTAG
ncbi:MAG: MMPL family transporter [Pseudomonadales bacterium]|nr:MMPL family transporter [Pseudomonadales bacterium]